MEPWFDTHVHLDRYPEAERVAMLARAAEAEVRLIAVAVDVDSSTEIVGLIGAATGVAGGVVGVHPKYAMKFRGELAALALEKGVVGIGECGFDDSVPDWALQAAAFVAQARIADELDLTLVLHIDGDGAWAEFARHEAALQGLRVVRHYFTGDERQAEWHAERGHYLSFGNPLRRATGLQEIARGYPPDLLLIETDSYPLEGRNTEPAHVVKVGETLALLRDWAFDEARERLGANTRRAFARLTGRS